MSQARLRGNHLSGNHDQLGRGVYVFVGRTGNVLCPVEAITGYVDIRLGPFFQFEDCTPLTKPKL